MNRLSTEKRALMVGQLVEGNSLRATGRVLRKVFFALESMVASSAQADYPQGV